MPNQRFLHHSAVQPSVLQLQLELAQEHHRWLLLQHEALAEETPQSFWLLFPAARQTQVMRTVSNLRKVIILAHPVTWMQRYRLSAKLGSHSTSEHKTAAEALHHEKSSSMPGEYG